MQFKNYLSQVINSNNLPGFEAQKLMAPASRHETLKSFAQDGISKKSSVLALINTHFDNSINNVNNSHNQSFAAKYSVLLTQEVVNSKVIVGKFLSQGVGKTQMKQIWRLL